MAAPVGRWLSHKVTPLIRLLPGTKRINGSNARLTLSLNNKCVLPLASHRYGVLQSLARVLFSSNRLPALRLGNPATVTDTPTGTITSVSFLNEGTTFLSTQQGPRNRRGFNSESGGSDNPFNPDNPDGQRPQKQVLKLMSFPARIWPHPMKTLRNLFLSLLIRGYMDSHFTPAYFLKGAEQAMVAVSKLVSAGNFDDLEGLVSRECVQEIRHNYHKLTPTQKEFLAVDPKDIFYKFIYEVGMIFDDQTDQRFVEITAVFHGLHGMQQTLETLDRAAAEDQMFVCNYRFIREYTKGQAEETDWTVNIVNHFLPKEVAKNTDMFTR